MVEGHVPAAAVDGEGRKYRSVSWRWPMNASGVSRAWVEQADIVRPEFVVRAPGRLAQSLQDWPNGKRVGVARM